MRLQFKTGGFSVKKFNYNNYSIGVSSYLNGVSSYLTFLTDNELRQIRNEINKILEDGDSEYAHDNRADAEQTSGMESVMER